MNGKKKIRQVTSVWEEVQSTWSK